MRTTSAPAILLAFWAALAGSAQAAPRRVVILNAAADQEAGFAAARRVRAALEREPKLSPLSPGDLSRALESPLAEETPEARTRKRAAEAVDKAASLVYFENKKARLALRRAEDLLIELPPTAEVKKLLAKLNFQLGLVHLEEQNRGLALTAFGVVRRLTPERAALDPGRYKPDIVKTFADAAKLAAAPATAHARISATFDGVDVYVDGKRVGAAPVEIDLVPGAHYLLAVSDDYRPSGARIHLVDGESSARTLPLERWSVEERARRLRRRLLGGEDALAAGRAVTTLAGADAAVILRGDEQGGVRAAIYRVRTGRLGPWQEIEHRVSHLLEPLIPAPPPEIPPGARFSGGPQRPPPERPWYQTPIGIAGLITSGVVVSVVGALAFTLQDGQSQKNRTGLFDVPQ